jgi:hypothetical protein
VGFFLLSKINEIFNNLDPKANQYSHEWVSLPGQQKQLPDIVKMADGQYRTQTDCSGFVTYILQKTAPKALQNIETYKQSLPQFHEEKNRWPRAYIYQSFFKSLAVNPQPYWENIPDLRQVQLGDIIAWCMEQFCTDTSSVQDKSRNTGHVAFIAHTPTLVTSLKGISLPSGTKQVLSIPVYDSSRLKHYDYTLPDGSVYKDSRHKPNDNSSGSDGVGKGAIYFAIDSNGKPLGLKFPAGPFKFDEPVTDGEQTLLRTLNIAIGRLTADSFD